MADFLNFELRFPDLVCELGAGRFRVMRLIVNAATQYLPHWLEQ